MYKTQLKTNQVRSVLAAEPAPNRSTLLETGPSPTVAPDDGIGLTRLEVAALRAQHGYNEVVEKKERALLSFARNFWGMSAWMLELIMGLSAVLGKYSDVAVVGVLLVVNAVLSFVPERRAAGVVAALRKRLQGSARVRRESSWLTLPARELVPGDLVRIRAGDVIPADLKLISGALSVDQSALTGESKEVNKSAGDPVSSGSLVRRGEGNALVTTTGANTSFGRTTELVQMAKPKLHIEAVVTKVTGWLFAIVGVLLCLVVTLSLVRGTPLVQILPLVLVLLMSAVPVALPVMFSVSTAMGARTLAKRGVLVTRLSAAEDAATMDVLCVDKTGTITMNQLAVTDVFTLGPCTELEVLRVGALASHESNKDPIDLAFLAAARERHAFDASPDVRPISFQPFDAANRRTESVVEQGGERLRMTKGAVRSIATICGLDTKAVEALEARAGASAAKGYRTLAVARGQENGPMELVGLVSLFDPPRPDAKELIAALSDRGIAVKMLTGDALEVAREVASAVGLRNIQRMADLRAADAQHGAAQTDLFAGAEGLAEVFPEDKYTVVKHLQAAGHITGMTGDGVNDAPALRQAEVGIAVSSATDVAKGAASVVLTDAGLKNIVALIEEGRSIYQRILTWIINKVSRTIFKASFVAIAYLVLGKFVVSVFVMLLLTLLTDFSKIALASDHVRPSRKPETWKIGGFIAVSVVLGLAMLGESLLLLSLAWTRFGLENNEPALFTFSFLLLLYFAAFSVISARERRAFWSTKPSRTLLVSLGCDAVLGTLLTYAGLPGLRPLPWWQTLLVFGYALASCLLVNDALKVVLIKWRVPRAVA